ncbi:phosphatase PAP2-related protein [Mucilaginibacter sp.]|uniref:phosphatase PAP2-related protein n=1 Tax=Mucilaginibacter sp. TaxID=1882438 RepID=UPI00326498DF
MEALQSPKTRSKILLGSVVTIVMLSGMPFFFGQIEKRNGIVLNDWVLAYLPAYNVSLLIFALIWGMAILIVYRALYNPHIYIKYAWTLFFVNLSRMITIMVFALDPPRGMVHLIDPITGIFYGNAVITKDLFYSGHTSTMVLVFLCLDKRNDKIIGFIAIICVMVLLLIQHIHYTIDVLAAPVFVYTIYLITSHFLKLDSPDKITGDEA